MPSVLVSTPLMKKRATFAPNGAISAATCGVLQILREHDAVVDVDAVRIDGRFERAEAEHRAERVVDRLLGIERLGAERASRRDVAGNVPTSNGTPLMKLVAVEVKNSCCRPGARKPVETAPRSAKLSVKS